MIRSLGMDLAQARVDLSFALARLDAMREVLATCDGHGVPIDLVMTLQSILS